MTSLYLHIVSFNIPYPADYGGVIDVYHKVKALSEAGIRIILHCFEYGRLPSKELEDLCFKVHYYPRKSGLAYLLKSDPYIVSTRNAKSMPDRLLKDSFPVLFEGLHSTAMLHACIRAKKRTLVRAHNIEHKYYRALARHENSLSKKLFFRMEARKLRRYEPVLREADYVLAIAKHESKHFEQNYGNALWIPAFHRFDDLVSPEGSGKYILFHGNLSIADNTASFLSLASKALSSLPYEVVVAGKNPPLRFQKRLAAQSNIRLLANPGDQELDELIRNAHINLLVSQQNTGLKLKLLHALHAGRHCLVNPAMVEGTGLESLCSMAGSPEEMRMQVDALMQRPFRDDDIRKRRKVLKDYSNRTSAEKIIRLLS